MTQLIFTPLLSWPWITAVAVLALLVTVLALLRGLRGWLWRGAALCAVALALAGPTLETAAREGLDDIVLLVEDRSASQDLPGRQDQTDAATEAMADAVSAMPGVDLRRVTVGDDPRGTRLGTALAKALAAEPESRLAGVIAVTDGRLSDPQALPKALPAPLQVLLTGNDPDWDRRLVVEQAPAFAVIGEPVTLRLRVEDQGAVPEAMRDHPALLRITRDGGEEQTIAMPPGKAVDLPVTVDHGGENIVGLAIDPPPEDITPPQLTDRNDSVALTITGVRDRLRVLLVSGEPHAGERTWRNLLKSDAAVDLIHFTILRPPEKGDAVPVDEMALIAFPTYELFMQRIDDFDLIIFDRYRTRGLLPPEYFDNIRRYVEEGGAILVSGGPEMASVEGLGMTPLGPILPGRTTGRVIDGPFLPRLTDAGRRHPVTAALPGAPSEGASGEASEDDDAVSPHWGRWLRRVEISPNPDAQVVMEADDGSPLLMLDHVKDGRVALLASDQSWLWARGFEGGGPQLELLRRIAHWSMDEPELEEEALEARAGPGLRLSVTRRTLKDSVSPLEVTGPDGKTVTLDMKAAGPGRFSAEWTAPAPGLYRLVQDDLSRLAALGPAAPREFEQTVADGGLLAPLAEASGGTVLALSEGVPELRQVQPGRVAHGRGVGRDWIAITPRGAETVTGRSLAPLLPGWGWLIVIAGLALAGWLTEARRRAAR